MGGDESRKNEGEGGVDGDSRTRIFIGGLGENVSADDLRKTFSSSVGAVDSVDIVRTKGRSFAYIDFIPSSDKALSKLFSTYNGCLWKGGRLRLEKAKEHYLLRLKKEWAEDAEIQESTPSNVVDATKNTETLENTKKVLKSDKRQIHIFFPKLKKVKSLPYSGSGKHKYSFRRIQVPSLPTHFCSCEEHSGPSYTARVEHSHDPEAQSGGINEEELKTMELVMSRLFKRENISQSTASEAGSAREEESSTKLRDDLIINEGDADDEDNLIMNMVGSGNSRVTSFGSQGYETNSANEESILQASEDRPAQNTLKNQKRRILPSNKKRKSVHAEENDKNESASATRKRKKEVLLDSENVKPDPRSDTHERKSETLLGSKIMESDPRTKRSNANISWSQKTAWRDLIGERGKSPFLVSDIMQTTAKNEEQPRSDGSTMPDLTESKSLNLEKPGNDEKQKLRESQPAKSNEVVSNSSRGENSKSPFLPSHMMETISTKEEQFRSDGSRVPDLTESEKQNLENHGNMEMQKLDEIQPAKPNEVVNKSARGAAWLQNSSWTQLVGDTSKGSFSISQFLPGSFGKQELLEPNAHCNLVKSAGSELAGDGTRNSGVTKDDVPTAPSTSNVVALAKKQNDTGLNVEQSTPGDDVQTVKENSEVSTLTRGEEEHLAQKQTSAKHWEISETCPFMKSATSMREWATTKTAISSSLKKKSNEKQVA